MAKKRTRKSTKPRARKGGTPVQARICNLVRSKKTEQDWSFSDALGEEALASGKLSAAAAAPSSIDLRAPWWTIQDQEDTGSCVGWAAADGVVRYHMVKAGRLSKTKLLSPRFVWMASKETDEFVTRAETFIEGAGTSLKAALDIVRKYGTVTMDRLPFHISTNMYTGPENTFYASAAQKKIAAYFNLHLDLAHWKSWLASQGPILAAVDVDQSWDNAAANGGNIDVFLPNTVRGGHAIAIVGYTSTGRFIVRNSWGTGWGDQGFGYVSPAYIAGGFYDQAYGVTL